MSSTPQLHSSNLRNTRRPNFTWIFKNILKRWLSAFVANHAIVLTPHVSILQVRAHVLQSCTDQASPNKLSAVNAFYIL